MDVNGGAVAQAFRAHGAQRMIHGHTHRPARHVHDVDGTPRERWVLADWHDRGHYLAVDERGRRTSARSPEMTPELFSPAWFSALGAIVAHRPRAGRGQRAGHRPRRTQRSRRSMQQRVVLWGTFGAIAIRAALTAVVV